MSSTHLVLSGDVRCKCGFYVVIFACVLLMKYFFLRLLTGHWSASSSSARHSLDSDGRHSASSPERLSFCDKDSAVSLNIHSPER